MIRMSLEVTVCPDARDGAKVATLSDATEQAVPSRGMRRCRRSPECESEPLSVPFLDVLPGYLCSMRPPRTLCTLLGATIWLYGVERNRRASLSCPQRFRGAAGQQTQHEDSNDADGEQGDRNR